ncbi:hypothetical protein PVAND_016591 [Polypedilum vanderplanki]|uniref:Uncharacterized protein n=1 Tax=Polypedilum vanderplanki TaxID=319348 RepID=A0A9J6BFI7_POLVA|nr:hypothetical protein PVAND_016591 [Polypedilum vanderplanki]
MADLRSSVIDEEIKSFNERADVFWDPNGPMMMLHKMIPAIRIPLVLDGLTESGLIKKENRDKSNVLEGLKILDVGSGAGLMSEPLALLGAEVVGIDPAEKLVERAREHLKIHENLKVTYICDTIESYCRENKEKFDAVTFFDVAEHVADLSSVLKASVECLKPGGQIFITTWNKTLMGWLYGIIMLEYVARIVPRGAHSISMFVNPEAIEALLRVFGCEDIETRGTWYSLWTKDWSFTNYKDVFYAMKAVKRK